MQAPAKHWEQSYQNCHSTQGSELPTALPYHPPQGLPLWWWNCMSLCKLWEHRQLASNYFPGVRLAHTSWFKVKGRHILSDVHPSETTAPWSSLTIPGRLKLGNIRASPLPASRHPPQRATRPAGQ